MVQEQQAVVAAQQPDPPIHEPAALALALPPAASRWIELVPLVLAFGGFIGLGLVSSRLGVAWTYIRATFGMPIDAISALLIAQLLGSVMVSANSGRLTARLNIGVMAAWSCGITAVALVGSSVAPAWAVLVVLGCFTGIGAGLIEASLNTYAATHFSPRSMNWLHASFGVGATLGLAIMTAIVAGSFGWRLGFLIIGIIELLLALCFSLTRHRWRSPAPAQPQSPRAPSTPLAETFRLPAAWLGILLFAAFTGAQVGAGQWFYTLLTEQRGVSAALAGAWVSFFWASLTIGRILFGFLVQRVAPTKLLRASIGAVLLGTIVFSLNLTLWLSLASILLLGLAMAPLYPLLTSATPQYLGKQHAANGIGLQAAAAGLGGVLVTSLLGVLAETFGLAAIAPTLVVAAVIMVFLFELLARHIAREL